MVQRKIKDFFSLAVFFDLLMIYGLHANPAETEVLTSSGSVPICDVIIGDDDVDVDSVMLAECVEKWKDVISNYVKALRKDKRFDICGKYEELKECLKSYVSLCRQYGGDSNQDWMSVMNQMELICTNQSAHHVTMHDCMVEEMGGVLSSRCDEYHQFNLKQKTRHECHFLREAIHCRVSLVSSGCGVLSGKLTFDLLKISHRKLTNRLRCHVTKEHNFKTFEYSTGCGRNFLLEIEKCTTRHLTATTIAEFHDDNDLVSTETEKDFRAACRAYRKFSSCLEPVNETCYDGIEMFLEYEGNLRRYMLKMNQACQEDVIDVYASSLRCYQSVMTNGQLTQCNVHWNNLRPWLSNITAYQFFCDPSHVNTVNLLLEIQKSHTCHSLVFQSECGGNASEVMAGLMNRALGDPLFLRLGFRPDCQLHNSAVSDHPHPDLLHPSSVDDDDDEEDDDFAEIYISSTVPGKYGPGGRSTHQLRDEGRGLLDHRTSPKQAYITPTATFPELPRVNSARGLSESTLLLTNAAFSAVFILLSVWDLC